MWNICKRTAGTHCFLFIFEFALFTYVALCSLFDLAFHWIVRKKNDLGLRPGDHRKTSHPADFQKQDYFLFWPHLALKYTAWKVSNYGVFSGPYFPYTPYLSVFSPDEGKYRPEKERIRTLFTQWILCKLYTTSYKKQA